MLRLNDTEISHGKVNWQTRSWSFDWAVDFIGWLGLRVIMVIDDCVK